MHKIIRHFGNEEICETDMEWQEEMQTNMNNQCRSNGAESFKKREEKIKWLRSQGGKIDES